MAALEVTASEFRTRLGKMLDYADNGGQIVIKRRHKPAYALVSVDDTEADGGDGYFTPEVLARIAAARQQIRQGKGITLADSEDIRQFFEAL